MRFGTWYSALGILGLVLLFLAAPLWAQGQAQLSLEAAQTDLQTGQTYEVNIRLDGIAEVWTADLEISYDPDLVYILGTKAGSPVQAGAFFNPQSSLAPFNLVRDNKLRYVVSLLGEVDPASGGGVVGTFRIYPLAPGKTQLQFSKAELQKVIFETTNQGRQGVGTELIPFTPVMVELNISGSRVEPPSEATATPTLTPTAAPETPFALETAEPTLVNVTAAARTPEPAATQPIPDATTQSSPLLPIAVLVMFIGAVGIVVVFIAWQRSRRR